MNRHILRIITVISSAVAAAIFIVLLYFTAPKIEIMPETSGEIIYYPDPTSYAKKETAVIGKDVTAVRLTDLKKISRITKVNYVADKFVSPDNITDEIQIVDLTKPFEFAKKGTLIFIVMNLDPESPDFKQQAEKLSVYKIGDYWSISLSLPKIFSASNIYADSSLVARHGDIENYDFINFTTNYDVKTDKFSQKVDRTSLDLNFYTRRQALDLYKTVTVHYQSSGSVYSGISDCPLIGEGSAIANTLKNSQNILIAFAVLAAVVIIVLIILSILKRTKTFVAAIVWVFGIVLMLFPKFILGQAASMPLLWAALSWSAVFITLGGALFSSGRNFGKFPAKFIFPALMAVGGIIAFIYPFVPFTAAGVLKIIFTVIKAIGAAALLVFACFEMFSHGEEHAVLETSTVAVIAVGVAASLFLPAVFPVYCNSLFWLCIVAVITTSTGVFKIFKDTEKANAYLTANLNLEVERQLKDIKAVITERDNLLQFVSHDMKKPLQSSATLLDTLIEREKDTEQRKALKIVKQHNMRVIGNLSEIGSYARFNYIAEPSQITNLAELCQSLYEFHKPDCTANGIVMKNLADKHYKVFVKKQGLENAVSNIVLNAIEHANCTTVTLSAKSEKNRIILAVSDDGKGIAYDIDVFKAYVSGNMKTDGVGLFICKNIIESMNGELTYESSPVGTTFYISLLKA